ncbi:MAG: hypothetical protein ACNI3C_09555 [Candidatus Marinarcus sp.]|uniref:hypothetical protein n=1 Tax=Candidatus Marinarcus sp. TaxID=3100987 RepID=UPI003B00478F
MVFHICEKIIARRRYTPMYAIAIIVVAFILYAYFNQKENTDWTMVIVFSSVTVITAGSLIFDAYRDINNMKQTSLYITANGICVDNQNENVILPFDRIKKIKTVYKNGEIKKLIVQTKLNITHDYSGFENLNDFNHELKKVLNKELWE